MKRMTENVVKDGFFRQQSVVDVNYFDIHRNNLHESSWSTGFILKDIVLKDYYQNVLLD